MKKLKTLFLVAFLLSVCALCFAACNKPKSLPQIAAPENIRKEDNFIVWNGVDGAAGYTVEIDGSTYPLDDARFDLSIITDPADYIIRIKTNGDGVTFADSGWVSRNYRYEIGSFSFRPIDGNSAYEVSGVLSLKDGKAKIPSKYNGKPVTAIGAEAFKDNEELTSVEIPDGVTAIKDGAFQNCSALTSAPLPQTLTALGEHAFQNTALTSVTIPDGVTELPANVFRACQSLESVTLPDGLKAIGNFAFQVCRNLKTAVLPEGLESVGEGAFKSCTNYEPNIPANVREIGGAAFSGTAIKTLTLPKAITAVPSFTNCKQLSEVTLHDGVISLRPSAFSGTAITSIFIPDGVTEISQSAFSDCSLLKEVRLPQGLTAIAPYAFMNCTALEEIAFPETLTSFSYAEPAPYGTETPSTAKSAFKGCTKLKSFNIVDAVDYVGSETFLDTAWYNAQPDGAVYYGRVFYKYKGIAPANTELTIREGTVCVSPEACCERNSFGNTRNNNITKVNFPESLTIIYDYAFASCRLTEIIMSPNITTLGRGAFGKIYGRIVLSPKLQTIGDGAIDFTKEFKEASGEIFIPKSVKYIGIKNFFNVDYLNLLVFEDPTGWYWNTNSGDADTRNHELEFLRAYNGTPIAVPIDVATDSEKTPKLFLPLQSLTVPSIRYPRLFKQLSLN